MARPECSLLPPDLSEWQIDGAGRSYPLLRRGHPCAAGPEATAVILRELAAVVALPEREDMALTMAIYLEDLQGLSRARSASMSTKEWRRNSTMVAHHRRACARCATSMRTTSVRLQRELKKLSTVCARWGSTPHPTCWSRARWMKDCDEEDAGMMAMALRSLHASQAHRDRQGAKARHRLLKPCSRGRTPAVSRADGASAAVQGLVALQDILLTFPDIAATVCAHANVIPQRNMGKGPYLELGTRCLDHDAPCSECKWWSK